MPSAWATSGLNIDVDVTGSVVTVIADSGDRYADTYFSDEWVSAQGFDPTGPAEALVEFERSCAWN